MKTIDEFITRYENIAKTKIEDAEEYKREADNPTLIFGTKESLMIYRTEKMERAYNAEETAAECLQLVDILKRAKEADEKEKQIRKELYKLTVYYTTKDNGIELVSRNAVNRVLNLVYCGSRDAEVENDGQ